MNQMRSRKWDLAGMAALISLLTAALVYIVSLDNSVDELRRLKTDISETKSINSILDAKAPKEAVGKLEGQISTFMSILDVKASKETVGELKGRISTLEGDKAVLTDFKAAVAQARAELEELENKKQDIFAEINKEIEKAKQAAKQVKGEVIKIVDSKLKQQMDSITKQQKSFQKQIGAKGISHFKWSYAGKISGFECVQIIEPSDPHTWTDNYLCYKR